jgi:hypothetical protein
VEVMFRCFDTKFLYVTKMLVREGSESGTNGCFCYISYKLYYIKLGTGWSEFIVYQ